jgi:uncharacterized membrane protein
MKVEKRILSVARCHSALKSFLIFSIPLLLFIAIGSWFLPEKTIERLILIMILASLLGFIIGFYSKKVRRWEIARWRRKVLNSKRWKEEFLRKFDSQAFCNDAKRKLEDKEAQIWWLKVVISREKKNGNNVTGYREWLMEVENTEVIDDNFLDHWNDLRKKREPRLKRIKVDIKKYERRIEIFDKLFAT